MPDNHDHPDAASVNVPQRIRFTRNVTTCTILIICIVGLCALFALLVSVSNSDEAFGIRNTRNFTIGKAGADSEASQVHASNNNSSNGNVAVAGNERSEPISDDIPADPETDGTKKNAEGLKEKPVSADKSVVTREAADPAQFLIAPLPELAETQSWQSPRGATGRSLFSGRDAVARKTLVESGGGSSESEAAVGLGLDWLARHQHKDGHWSLDAFHQTPGCDGRCTMHGVSSNTAGTALGVLPFLAHGNTHKDGKYHEQVSLAIDWLVHDLDKDGAFKSFGLGTMYAQGQGAIALCEILAMTSERKFRPYAKRAIDFIVSSQHSGGGWRYTPQSAGDTSVLGWQVLALRSAMQARLSVPKSTLQKAARFLDSVQSDKSGATYGYMPGRPLSPTMSAEGLLSRIYTGWRIKRAGIESGTVYLLNNMPQTHLDIYYWYYATQVMHEYGGTEWDRWNAGIRDFLIGRQEQEGHARGSWPVAGGHDSTGGRLYATSLCLLTLQVYYRHTKGQ